MKKTPNRRLTKKKTIFNSIGADNILFKDEFLIVINKPAGILSQPDESKGPVAAQILRQYLKMNPSDFLAPIHRLDRNTSGCMVFALSPDVASKLSKDLVDGNIRRTYHAIVKGIPDANGRIEAKLSKDNQENKSFVREDGSNAVTLFKRLRKFTNASLVEAWLETGRSHQIRAHFAHIGAPLLGDHKYANSNWAKLMSRPALHAHAIRFLHPDSREPITCTCNYPEDFAKMLATLIKISSQQN